MPDLDRPDAIASREDVLRLIQTPRDPQDVHLSIPIFLYRHILCSESTSFVGFIPPTIHNRPFHMFDPLPPTTATTAYNNNYFSGVTASRRGKSGQRRANPDVAEGGGGRQMMAEFINNVFHQRDTNPTGWREALMDGWRRMMGQQVMGQGLPAAQREEAVEQMMAMAEEMVQMRERDGDGDGPRGEDAPMPGGFPGT